MSGKVEQDGEAGRAGAYVGEGTERCVWVFVIIPGVSPSVVLPASLDLVLQDFS